MKKAALDIFNTFELRSSFRRAASLVKSYGFLSRLMFLILVCIFFQIFLKYFRKNNVKVFLQFFVFNFLCF